MAIYSRSEKTLRKDAAIKQQYLKYVKEYNASESSDKQPMTYYHWKKSGRSPTYFKGTETTIKEAKLRRSERKRFGLKD